MSNNQDKPTGTWGMERGQKKKSVLGKVIISVLLVVVISNEPEGKWDLDVLSFGF